MRLLGFCWSWWRPCLRHQSPFCPALGGCSATPIAPPDPPSPSPGAGLTSWMSTSRRRCSPSRRTRCMLSCSGATCRDARSVARGSPRKRSCCNSSSRPPRRTRLPCTRPPWRARLLTAIPRRWWTPCTRGPRGSGRRSCTPRGQVVSGAVTRLERRSSSRARRLPRGATLRGALVGAWRARVARSCAFSPIYGPRCLRGQDAPALAGGSARACGPAGPRSWCSSGCLSTRCRASFHPVRLRCQHKRRTATPSIMAGCTAYVGHS